MAMPVSESDISHSCCCGDFDYQLATPGVAAIRSGLSSIAVEFPAFIFIHHQQPRLVRFVSTCRPLSADPPSVHLLRRLQSSAGVQTTFEDHGVPDNIIVADRTEVEALIFQKDAVSI